MLRYIVRAAPQHSRGFHIRIGDHLHSPTIAKLTPSLLHRHAIPRITVHPAKATFHSTARNEGGPLIPILASMFKVRAPTSPLWINSNGSSLVFDGLRGGPHCKPSCTHILPSPIVQEHKISENDQIRCYSRYPYLRGTQGKTHEQD